MSRIARSRPTQPPQCVTSWRDILLIHPAAELFPLISADEQRELGEDIQQHGLLEPVALWRGGPKGPVFLLDGRNRLDAIEISTGKPVWTSMPYHETEDGQLRADYDNVVVLDSSIDPWDYVRSKNAHRRHLTAKQKREAIEKALKAHPERSDRQIAEQWKASPTTVGQVRRKT